MRFKHEDKLRSLKTQFLKEKRAFEESSTTKVQAMASDASRVCVCVCVCVLHVHMYPYIIIYLLFMQSLKLWSEILQFIIGDQRNLKLQF